MICLQIRAWLVLAHLRLVWIAALSALPSNAMADPRLAEAALCDHAAQVASAKSGVPLAVLRAITRTETGRRINGQLAPWPWTVNLEGKGFWFETQDEARAFAYASYKKGARSFDTGCFQINFRWHGEAFASITDMFDPQKNADYAARFLSELFAETGDWSKAAGAYHSRTRQLADRYRARFDSIRTAIADAPVQSLPTSRSAGNNGTGYPLLFGSSAPTRLGSLVPIGQPGGARHILGSGAGRPLFPRSTQGGRG